MIYELLRGLDIVAGAWILVFYLLGFAAWSFAVHREHELLQLYLIFFLLLQHNHPHRRLIRVVPMSKKFQQSLLILNKSFKPIGFGYLKLEASRCRNGRHKTIFDLTNIDNLRIRHAEFFHLIAVLYFDVVWHAVVPGKLFVDILYSKRINDSSKISLIRIMAARGISLSFMLLVK